MYMKFDFTFYRYFKGYLMCFEDESVIRFQEYLSNLPKPNFMPTRLVRIDDMEIVNGSDVNEGYCALSYSWNQSGRTFFDAVRDKYIRIDERNHEIISYDNNVSPYMIISDKEIHNNDKLKKIREVLNIMEENEYFAVTYEFVKFEGVIQKICQLFNIKYIWYDQMCINQNDKEEKQREIRNMHHIYSNAYCTVALVPDYEDCYLGLSNNGEEYFKRLWTLEEAIKSKRILFVGPYTFISGRDASYIESLSLFSRKISEISVAQLLYHAHQRTSTKEHDRVFALIHLFPEFMEYININYDLPLEDLMMRFYDLLASKDIRILLFGEKCDYNSTIQQYKFLPSWTGINGMHITDDVTTSFRNYVIVGKTMYVTSEFVTNGQHIDIDALAIRKEDIPPPPGNLTHFDNEYYYYYLFISVQLPGSGEIVNISLIYNTSLIAVFESCLVEISERLKQLSRFMEIKKENLNWCHEKRENYQKVIRDINFNKLTEDMDNLSAQYIILSEVAFKNEDGNFYYPVIKRMQGEEYYKAIGCCFIKSKEDIFSDCNLPKQTFSIQ